jgi:hypothetical protein
VPCEVSGDGEFAVPMQALRDAIKGHKAIDLVYANATLTIKAGSYSAALTTVDVIPLDPLDDEKTKDWKLTTDQAQWLRTALKTVALKPTSIFSTWMPAGIKLTEKSAFVVCYDEQHMNWVSSKEVTGEFECVLPIDTLTNIIEVFHKGSFVFKQGAANIVVKNKLITVVLSVPSSDDLPTIDQVQKKIREAAKVDGQTFAFEQQDLLTFLDNARSVIGKERAEVSVRSDEGKLKLEVKTGQGAVRNVIKGKGRGGFKVDYEYIQEMAQKGNASLELNVVDKAFIGMKLAASSAIVALNQ